MKTIKEKLTCIGYSKSGNGLVNYKNKQIEVPNLLINEIAIIDIKKVKNFYTGRVSEIIKESDMRVKAPCPYYNQCGGCQLQHFSKQAQKDYKQKLVAKSLKSFGKPKDIEMMEDPSGYRNKSHHSYALNKKGNIISGLYQNYTHKVIPVDKCLIQDRRADKIAKTISDIMPIHHITPYNEDNAKGVLRHVLIRVAKGTDQILVALITGSKHIPNQKNFLNDLLEKHPEITTIVHNINDKKTSVVLGKVEHILYGKGEITDTLCGKSFIISAKSFYQINKIQTEKLYKYALHLAKIKKSDIVLDAYCGIGTIGILAAQNAKQVIGVEVNSVAIKDAKRNAKRNQIKNIDFYDMDAADYLQRTQAENITFDTVFLDPPRMGCSKAFIESLKKHAPKQIIYISCNPETQARDIKQLKRVGYSVQEIKAFDMFAYTSHCEVVTLLQRIEK